MEKIYGKWYPWQELSAYPMMLYYFIKGKKLKELLEEKIAKAKKKATKKEFSERELYENQIEYDKLDNLFSLYFKEVDKSDVHSFKDKIEYCLQKYKLETQKHLTASRVVILQGNFLTGAEKTLYLYFTLLKTFKKEVPKSIKIKNTQINYNIHLEETTNNMIDNSQETTQYHIHIEDKNEDVTTTKDNQPTDLKSIFTKEDYIDKFKELLTEEGLFVKDKIVLDCRGKNFLVVILAYLRLRKIGVIHHSSSNKKIIDFMKLEYDWDIPKATFSTYSKGISRKEIKIKHPELCNRINAIFDIE